MTLGRSGPRLRAAGLLVVFVAFVETVSLGWKFGVPSGWLPVALGVGVAALVALVTVLR